ncbi:MAG: ParB/RepB/Spo0J family partition protein [Nitrososphaeraceae archaeon]
MSKELTTSNTTRGLLVDIDIYQIRHPPTFYRSTKTNSVLQTTQLAELSKSIVRQGLLQPIVVRAKADTNHFEIVSGNRRYEACKALGWRKIVCHVLELDDRNAFEVTLIENIQRENLDPIEEARAFKIYVEEYGWGGISDLASRLGKSASYVDKRIKLLDSPAEIIERLSNHSISPSIVEELSPINDQKVISDLVEMINKKGLSSRKVRKLVKEYKKESSQEVYNFHDAEDKIVDIDRKVQNSFDKSIVALRIAASRIAAIVESMEDNWIIYEILMQHKMMLHSQIDVLIKEKKKI